MKLRKYLAFYHRCLLTGELPRCGLCNCFGSIVNGKEWVPRRGFKDFKLMFPVDTSCYTYWAYGDSEVNYREPVLFTPLRQNIVLFMAAMNGEM